LGTKKVSERPSRKGEILAIPWEGNTAAESETTPSIKKICGGPLFPFVKVYVISLGFVSGELPDMSASIAQSASV
jgi:hypothetical protein